MTHTQIRVKTTHGSLTLFCAMSFCVKGEVDVEPDSDAEENDEDGADKKGKEVHPRTRPVSEKKIKKQRKQTNASDLAGDSIKTPYNFASVSLCLCVCVRPLFSVTSVFAVPLLT